MEMVINYCVDLVETGLGTATCLTFPRLTLPVAIWAIGHVHGIGFG